MLAVKHAPRRCRAGVNTRSFRLHAGVETLRRPRLPAGSGGGASNPMRAAECVSGSSKMGLHSRFSSPFPQQSCRVFAALWLGHWEIWAGRGTNSPPAHADTPQQPQGHAPALSS